MSVTRMPWCILLGLLPWVTAFSLNVAVMELHPAGNSLQQWQEEEVVSVGDILEPANAKATDEIVAEAGYPVETHVVATSDGYLLMIHRIPGGREGVVEREQREEGEEKEGREKREERKERPVVFLQHGLMASSADWVVAGPGHGLAFLLADRGYDVWMGNYRGNRYSRQHIDPPLPPVNYWDFSWDEMAEHDLPTMLKHMMQVSGQTQFHYIGHSMGTLTYFTACNYHPWIANATKLMVGYGAHTRVPHMASTLFRLMSRWVDDISWVMEAMGVNQFMPANWLTEWLASEVCDEHMHSQAVCKNILFLIAGYNPHEMNSTLLPVIMGHTPAGTSVNTMLHYAQSVKDGTWSGLDRGSPSANVARWNSTSPPPYSYRPVTAPVALYWGQKDILVVPQDEMDLAGRLPNLVTNVRVADNDYTHLDFLWGVHNTELVYGPTMDLMDQYTGLK